MKTSISAVGFTLSPSNTELIETKLKRVAYADDLIIDLIVHAKHDKNFKFETTVNFRWGVQAHVSSEDDDFAAALNKMVDTLDVKIKKEKDKVQGK